MCRSGIEVGSSIERPEAGPDRGMVRLGRTDSVGVTARYKQMMGKFSSASSFGGFFGKYLVITGALNAGQLAIVQGTGYPNPNRSHFRSTEIWQTGSDSNKFELRSAALTQSRHCATCAAKTTRPQTPAEMWRRTARRRSRLRAR